METPALSHSGPEQERAYAEAAREIGTSIALGLVPFLAQAIDIYDTVESIWRIQGAKTLDTKEDAKFDLILALVGWIPGPGDGVKKSLRLINRDPQRFAPILFDLLRGVCVMANIKTSPEVLLEKLFDARMLASQIGEIRTVIEGSSVVKKLSPESQQTIRVTLKQIEHELPAWVGIVQKRLKKWKKVQRNSSASEPVGGFKKTTPVQPKDASVAEHGKDRAAHGVVGDAVRSEVAAEPLPMGHTLFGVSGEHIADYHCAEKWGWAKGWDAHDLGNSGEWKTKPDKTTPGKLSNKTKLFHLTTKPNEQGIDAVWRVPAGDMHNHGKPYAIIEVKAGQTIEAKSFSKSTAKGKKRSVTGKLGVTGRPKLEDLLEPPTGEETKQADKKKTRQKGAGGTTPKPTSKSQAPKKRKSKTDAKQKQQKKEDGSQTAIMVQMSREWIEKNLKKAVGPLKRDVESNYSRHLFDIPRNLPCAEQHAQAYEKGTTGQAITHTDHDVDKNWRHDEDDVKRAVNIKKANLRKKYPNMKSLEAEK